MAALLPIVGRDTELTAISAAYAEAAAGQSRVLLISVPGGIEHYFGEINHAASAADQERIGAKYGIRLV